MPRTAKEIVMAAYHYLADVTPPTQKISEVRVEEIQPLDDGGTASWKVILSFDNVGEFPFDRKREYKEFKVNDADAKVLYMRQVNVNQ